MFSRDLYHYQEIRVHDEHGNSCSQTVESPRVVTERGCSAVYPADMRYPFENFVAYIGGGSYDAEEYQCDFKSVTGIELVIDASSQEVYALDLIIDFISGKLYS